MNRLDFLKAMAAGVATVVAPRVVEKLAPEPAVTTVVGNYSQISTKTLTYDMAGLRESLRDAIYDISPTSSPFMRLHQEG